MFRRAIWALGVAVLLAAPMAVQAQEEYLDVYIAKAKPEKVAEFNTIAKKMADANRRFNGDHWLTLETLYGDGNTYVFVSTRQNYADIDKSSGAFVAALNKAYGKEAADKMLHDWDNCLASSRTELRRRRLDLSRKVPADAASYSQLLGQSRVLRSTVVHVRPGHVAEFEALLKETKATGDQNPNTQPLLISQVIEGSNGTTFYVTALRSSLGGFDKNPTTLEILGEEGYKKFLKVNAEAVESAESSIYRFSPELSNPPEELVAAAPDFWHTKASMATASATTSSKPKASVKSAAEKPKQ
jgi:quinol monooxygenase YgiN